MIEAPVSPSVQKVAEDIRHLSLTELMQLAKLVPQLEQVKAVSADVEAAVEYFREELLRSQGSKPVSLDDPFIGGLTHRQFLALSEAEQDDFWDKLFAEGEIELEAVEEVDVKPDARVPARQKRRAPNRARNGKD
jgi:hypothetical protein